MEIINLILIIGGVGAFAIVIASLINDSIVIREKSISVLHNKISKANELAQVVSTVLGIKSNNNSIQDIIDGVYEMQSQIADWETSISCDVLEEEIENCRLSYPRDSWESLPARELIENLETLIEESKNNVL